MSLARARLDRFLAQKSNVSRRSIRLLLAQKRVLVDGRVALDIDEVIDQFSHIVVDGETVQANTAHYVMLNKPIGVVSATQDEKHKTVIDILPFLFKNELHIVGRLDLNTSGLMLLTNDSRWSERLTSPQQKVSKRYLVTLEQALSNEYIEAFAQGMYFEYEGITTQPAKLSILSTYTAQVDLIEGRYHQIKRMFGRFQNKVVGLHRMSIGSLKLDEQLLPGDSRLLNTEEVSNIFEG